METQNNALPADTPTPDPDQFKDWKKKITLFLSSQFLSIFGSSVVSFAIIWYITLTTTSGVMMLIGTLCAYAPQIIISLFAGVWADRYDRKKLVILGDSISALVALLLAFAFMGGMDALWLLFLALGLRSIGAGIQMPAESALLPQIVPLDKLTNINGINTSIVSLNMLIAPAVAGALLAATSLSVIFFVDVVTAILAIGILLLLKVKPHLKAQRKENDPYFGELKQGLKYIKNTGFAKSLVGYYAAFMFLVTPAAVLTPLLIARSFGDAVWMLTANEIVYSVGTLLAGMLIAWKGGFKNRIMSMTLGYVLFGVFTACLGISGWLWFWLFLVFMFGAGLVMPFFSNPAVVILQENVPQDMMGRVFSMIQIVATAAVPLGMFIFGPLADIMEVEVLLIITGVLIVILGAFLPHIKVLQPFRYKKEAPTFEAPETQK